MAPSEIVRPERTRCEEAIAVSRGTLLNVEFRRRGYRAR